MIAALPYSSAKKSGHAPNLKNLVHVSIGEPMIDLHTHLLPDWDDGAKDWDESFKMSKIAKEDGIDKIVLTPHIYRLSKYGNDLAVLETRFSQFYEKMKRIAISFYRGAEVYIHHEMAKDLKKYNFTVHGSNYLFIEFPEDHILPGVKDLLFRLMLDAYIPIISHPERNAVFGDRPGLFYDLVCMGCLGQVTADSLDGAFGRHIKKTAELFLRNNLVHVIASDAHNEKKRPPRLSHGVEKAAKIVGAEKALAMVTAIPQAILDNKAIPDYGEPVNPVKHKKKWAIRLPKFQ